MTRFIVSLRRQFSLLVDGIGGRLRNNFYIYAAVILSIFAIIDAFTFNFIVGMRNKSFDTMVKYRFHVAPPSSNIVIVDIDEKSLAAMSAEYGRWPWPRQVFGEFVEKIEVQKPDAIVFDILFSDPDVYNSESDSYFNQAIARTGNTWFPMVRLPSDADQKSSLKPGQIPGARLIEENLSDTTSTIAAVLPFFESIQRSGRIGINNIRPDNDGVCREYPVRHREYGYEIASLPYAVVRSLKPGIKVPVNILMNWRGKPFTYPHISFSDLFEDLRREHPRRPAGEFAGKIVIIGSTAPSLFDFKVTAVDWLFPGVEILATAIDNIQSCDWLRVPNIPFVYFLFTLVILWTTALGFFRRGRYEKLDRFYGVSQFILIAVAYSAINLFNVYINLTGPVMFGFVYFSIARYYAFATARALDNSVVRLPADTTDVFGYLLALRFDLPTREEALLAKLSDQLKKKCRERPSTEWLSGRQKGFWRLFENTLFLCWQAENGRQAAIRAEADAVVASLPGTLGGRPMNGALPFERLSISRAEGGIGSREKGDWRMLMGAALLHSRERNQT